jgi:hypothetical protein
MMAETWIRRILMVITFIGSMASGTAQSTALSSPPGIAPEAAAQPMHQKATWLWTTDWIRRDPREVLSFFGEHGVNLVYLQVNPDIPASDYQRFIKQAAGLGIEVDALGGAPEWGLAWKRQEIADFVAWVQTYQQAAEAGERFRGIHVDIEPHLLPEWKTNRPDVIKQWESNVQYLRTEADRMKLPLSADIPFWLGNGTASDGKTPLDRFMIGQFDSVTVMSYRDTAQAIAGIAEDTFKEAAALGKTALAAVETNPSREGDFLTFHEEGAGAMNEQIAKLHDMIKNHPSYAGIAVHDFDGWREMKQ